MIIQATDEQVQKMCALAVNASQPMGMGYLHYRPEDEYKPEDFRNYTCRRGGVHLDYVDGRMVKLNLWPLSDGLWRASDVISGEYESWVVKYPSYKELAEAAGATVKEEVGEDDPSTGSVSTPGPGSL